MSKDEYDLVAIGGGTAALVATIAAAGVGGRTALIEMEKPGGDCLWTGCVPSKALLSSAALAHDMRSAASVGLQPVEPDIDFASVMAHVKHTQAVIEPHDSAEHLTEEGVEVIIGRGEFLSPGKIKVGDRVLEYRSALIATGSQPVVPPIPGLREAQPLTSHNVWDLETLPARLVVLGGGPIGCELGQAFGRLGSHVTLIEAESTLVPRESPEVGAHLGETLVAEGVDVRVGVRAESVETHEGAYRVNLGDGTSVDFDRILVSVGRRANSSNLGLDLVGVEVDDRGHVVVDDTMRTTGSDIFAAGDVTGKMPFTPVAAHQARAVVMNALFKGRKKAKYDTIPWVTFTDPEIARVGLDATAAREKWGAKTIVERFDYANLDRAITHGRTGGWVEIIGDKKRRIVGATIVGEAAGESIAEIVAFMTAGAKIDALSTTVHAYPTFSEGASRAADNVLRARYFSPRVRKASAFARRVLRFF